MDKNTINKLTLLIAGLENRILEDFDMLIDIRGYFTAGTKQTAFVFNPDDSQLKMKIGAEGRIISINKFKDTVLYEANRQDSLHMEVHFRGDARVLDAENGKTSYKSLPKGYAMQTLMDAKAYSIDGISSEQGKNLFNEATKSEKSFHHAYPVAGGLLTNRDYLVKPGEADHLLKEIGIMAENGKVRNDRIRKYNQIDHFIELLLPIIDQLAKEKRELFIVDCASGKSYLSFVLNYYLQEVAKKKAKFLGIDYAEGVIASSKETAKRLGYRNMNFYCGDLRELLIDEEGPIQQAPDLVLSLHACDIATDYALAFGMRNNAKAIVSVPCCHHELVNQIKTDGILSDVLRFGPLKARLADTLTDALRCLMLEAAGYEVSCVEWVSPLETPKNLMIRAEKMHENNDEKFLAYKKLAKEIGANLTLQKEMRGFV